MNANTISIDIDASSAQALLVRLRTGVNSAAAIHRVAAEAVAREVRPWFIARNAARSRTRSNYWAQAAEAIHTEASPSQGTVIIRHPGITWHRHGGTINAKPGKALAIPLRDAVYGVWPSEYFKSRKDAFVFRHRGKAFLAARPGKGIPSAQRQLRILYLLLKSVSKGPDESVLPPVPQMQAAATAAARSFIHRAIAGHTP